MELLFEVETSLRVIIDVGDNSLLFFCKMFYDEEGYLDEVLPSECKWRDFPRAFWWNYRTGILPTKVLKLMISEADKSDGEILHTQV